MAYRQGHLFCIQTGISVFKINNRNKIMSGRTVSMRGRSSDNGWDEGLGSDEALNDFQELPSVLRQCLDCGTRLCVSWSVSCL